MTQKKGEAVELTRTVTETRISQLAIRRQLQQLRLLNPQTLHLRTPIVRLLYEITQAHRLALSYLRHSTATVLRWSRRFPRRERQALRHLGELVGALVC